MGDEYKFKSRVVNTNIRITNAKGKKVQAEIEQKQVVFYSEKYARKARKDRQKVLDKETGEILEKDDYLYIDEERVAEEEKYDGYYLIVSNELNMPDREIIERYKGLWKIE